MLAVTSADLAAPGPGALNQLNAPTWWSRAGPGHTVAQSGGQLERGRYYYASGCRSGSDTGPLGMAPDRNPVLTPGVAGQ